MSDAPTVELRVWRQDRPDDAGRYESFLVRLTKEATVLSALMEVARNPVTADGQATTPVAFEANCLEEVCGACSMVINGVPRQGCSALLESLEAPIVVEPFGKFPLVRDLVVDRSRMFEALKKVEAFIHIDGSHDLGFGPRMSPDDQQVAYAYSNCMTCGCCVEVCPQYGDGRPFIGAAAIGQVALFNAHPTGRLAASRRLHALMGEGGVADCGNAQNCVAVCPKEIPLTEAIARMGRATTVQWFKDLFGK